MNSKLIKNILNTFYITGICLFISACDGGIFGTGDGGSDSLIINGSSTADADISGSDNLDAAGDADSTGDDVDSVEDSNTVDTPTESAGDTPDAIPPSSSISSPQPLDNTTESFVATEHAAASINGSLSFTNTFALNNSPTQPAQVVFSNRSDNIVNLFDSQDGDAQSILTIQPNSISVGVLPLTSEALFVDFINGQGVRINQITIDPLAAVDDSISLLIFSETSAGIRLLAMPSFNESANNGVLPIRFASTGLAGDPNVSSTLVLTPDAAFDSSESLPTLSFSPITNDLPITNFQNVPVGNYLLSDDAGRYSELNFNISESSAVNTIILNPDNPSSSVNIEF